MSTMKYQVIERESVPFHEEYPHRISAVMDLHVFEENRTKPLCALSDSLQHHMRLTRKRAVPPIQVGTIIQKIIPEEEVQRYLGTNDGKFFEGTVGFVTRWQDAHFETSAEYIEELALTYRKSKFFKPVIDGVVDLSN